MKFLRLLLILGLIYVVSLAGIYVIDTSNLFETKFFHKVSGLVLKIPNSVAHRIEKNRQGLSEFEIPYDTNEIPDGKGISSQFISNKGRFVFVGVPKTSAYRQPRTDAMENKELMSSERVRVVHIRPTIEVIGSVKTKWVFVTSEDGKEPLGWVPNNVLGYKNSFTRVRQWYFDSFDLCKGEYCASYAVDEAGNYENHWRAEGKGIYLKGKEKGILMKYNNVIWAKKRHEELYFDVFLKQGEDSLNHEAKYQGSPFKIVLQ